MVKAKTTDIPGLLQKLPAHYRGVLVYGRDEGMVRERAQQLARQIVEDLSDPFQVARPGLQQIKETPSLLADEMGALSMMGGRRVILVDQASDAHFGPASNALAITVGDNLLILAAGDLAPRSRLRRLFEETAETLALPCYGDSQRDLDLLIDDIVLARGFTVARDAAAYLKSQLGVDRQISRNELEKLVLYMGSEQSGQRISLADAKACVGDQTALALGQIAAAATGGDIKSLDRLLERAIMQGETPVAVLRVAQKRLQRLHLTAGLQQAGASADAAMGKLRPPVFFMEKEAFRQDLKRWNVARLSSALAILAEAEAGCKSTGFPAEAICARALTRIALAAKA